jgi:hypothetical protein
LEADSPAVDLSVALLCCSSRQDWRATPLAPPLLFATVPFTER